jgi:hypothetical protein
LLKVQNVKKIFEIQLLMMNELLKVHFEDSKIKILKQKKKNFEELYLLRFHLENFDMKFLMFHFVLENILMIDV